MFDPTKLAISIDEGKPFIVPPKEPMPRPRQYWLVTRKVGGEEVTFRLDCLKGEFWTVYATLGYNAEVDMDAEGVVVRELISEHRV